MTRNPLRGLHLRNGVHRPKDYEAIGIMHPGSVLFLSAQLDGIDPIGQVERDTQLVEWLHQSPDVLQICRMWPVKHAQDPAQLAAHMSDLAKRFPRIAYIQPCNEPDIEWPNPDWSTINQWCIDVWYNFDYYRKLYNLQAKLLFPPFAQWSQLDPEGTGYNACETAIRLYIGNGDGLCGHEYWDKGNVYGIEANWPWWLRSLLEQPSTMFVVGECGRRPIPENGLPDYALGEELVQFTTLYTSANVVCPFILSSPGGVFDMHDFVDKAGNIRPHAYAWGWHGP